MKVHFTKKAFKEYEKLPQGYKKLLHSVFDRFKKGENLDIDRVKGEKDTYRIRLGRYRVLFIRIKPDILIVKISPRGEAYK